MTTIARSSPSLSPASSAVPSHLNGSFASGGLSRTLSTIRAVTSFDDKPRQSFDDASSTSSPSLTRNSNSAFSSSVNSNVSTSSFTSQPQSPPGDSKSNGGRLKHSAAVASLPSGSRVSNLEVPSARSDSSTIRPDMGTPSRESSLSKGASKMPIAASMSVTSFDSPTGGRGGFNDSAGNRDAMTDGQQVDGVGGNGWDSTVGKAGLGKTGRVINRLVSDNEALKRDLKIEALKAEEAKQAARLLEDKMERIISDYESQLFEASVTKTLLARKERQVESLQGIVQLEKKRTTDAQDRERTWREEMEKIKFDSKRQVEEATGHAALMEGRYNAISSHWRDQGETVKRAAARMGKDVKELSEARRQDDEKINMLRDLCDQQDSNIKLLIQQKEDIARKFAEYKKEQEDLLHDIKTNAARREAEQEGTLEEARQVLDKLKWSLNIKNTIDWAS
ncbi:hypothetical protein HMPREF1624_01774 [Sporothrix schenckii ATCC 58251]|uniref:SWI5-dependent HO expression protein 3 n=2 Tax=Sporothrix schenckii TaxID=29908 RepID=U7Q6H2_SPOS1|nr:hypothetical protein HMPREF1624_01774 [Sporothrix schenckii ATCC 58251]